MMNIYKRKHWTSRTKMYLCLSSILVLAGLGLYCVFSFTENFIANPTPVPDFSKSSNYFLTEEEYDKMGYLVNTTQCRIPSLKPLNPSIMPFINHTPPIDCGKQSGHWTYVNKTSIVLNKTAIKSSGYKLGHLHCCYRSIHRDPSLSNNVTGWYSKVVDSRIVYSETCTTMGRVTEPNSEFVFVTCEPRYFYWYFDERLTSKVVYKNFHALIPKQKSDEIETKMKHWRNEKRQIAGSPDNRPPNVIILGIDSTSRLNFRRSMPKTIQVLESIGAHEMLGYTKVGDNTFPNLVSLLTGYNSGEFHSECWFTDETKLDDCPFIWKRFSEANYLTAEIQDSPRRNNWNLEKTGFVMPPTTFYTRPFLLGIHLNAGFYPYRVECVGYQTVEETLLGYMQDLMEFSHSSRTPLFLMSWLTQLAHDAFNALQFGDSTFAVMLDSLKKQGALDNTILLVVSDHGYRYGDVRESLSGYYEDKLPNFWIRLPPWIVNKYPEWNDALKVNTRQLSSNFYIYQTFNHILDTFSSTSDQARTTTGDVVLDNYGHSLFKPISKNTSCDSAGIHDSFCACDFPISLPQSSAILKEAANAAVKYINDFTPEQCSKFTLLRVKGGANLSKLSEDKNRLSSRLLVEFTTVPGEFIFEATVERIRENSTTEESNFQVQEDVHRLSQFNTDLSCMKDPDMQLYCFCL